MTPPPLVDANGRRFPLGSHLASGGEGAVYELPNDPTRVAKVYHQGHLPDATKAAKLTAMVALADPKLLSVAAWPSGLIFHAKSRQVVGFVMPRLSDYQPIQQLYNPVQRLKCFPRSGWAFQIRAAQNLAAAFDEVHKAGCLMADVNQSNAMLAANALVRLIDCDSFQVRANGKQYLCDVGTPHYVPPELQGKPLRGLVRTENHDRFGLAVLIFQLLFVGRHPYQGIYHGPGDPSFEQFIAGYMFAHSPAGRAAGMNPPPHTPTLTDVPSDLGMLFCRAFDKGSEAGTRPTTAEWLPALKRLEQGVAECTADPGHKYWRGVGACVWCRLESNGGPEYYFGVADDGTAFAVDEARLQEVQRRLAAAGVQEFPYVRDHYRLGRSPTPTPLPDEISRLSAECKLMSEHHLKVILESQFRERQTEERRVKRLEAHRGTLTHQLEKQERAWEADLRDARDRADAEARDRRHIGRVLAVLAVLGIAVLPLALVRPVFVIIGAVVTIVFGTWFVLFLVASNSTPARRTMRVIHAKRAQGRAAVERALKEAEVQADRERREATTLTEAANSRAEAKLREAETNVRRRVEAERNRRLRSLRAAEEGLTARETQWGLRVEEYRTHRQRAEAEITARVAECRDLASRYQAEFGLLTVRAEVAARTRHLRLHLLADADIPKIGAGRKQTLASYGIYTAADLDRNRISQIKGFGESLTCNLMLWREEVSKRFRFDPKTSVPSADRRVLVGRFRSRQQQLLSEAGRRLSELESLAPQCRISLERLVPGLKQAVAVWEQAEADLRLVPDIN